MAIKRYKIIFSPTSLREIREICLYISEKLYAPKAAVRLIDKIEKQLKIISYSPKIHNGIGRTNEDGRVYRKLIVNQYIILYVISEEEKEVRISHIFYKKSNYLKRI